MALLPMGAICGASVTGRDGEALGTVTELMVDAEAGGIAYAVLTHGGLLGVGEKLFAVPWRRFRVDAANGALSLDVDANRLDQLEGFDKDAWPTEGDPRI